MVRVDYDDDFDDDMPTELAHRLRQEMREKMEDNDVAAPTTSRMKPQWIELSSHPLGLSYPWGWGIVST